MSLRKKILFTTLLFLLILLTSLAGGVLYFYLHPDSVKPLVEKTLSRAAGGTLTIRSLAYSLKPLTIRAEGIRLDPGKGLKGLDLEIPRLEAHMSLEGPFGRRRLILNSLKTKGFSCRISRAVRFPGIPATPEGSSLFSRGLKGLAAFFLFRDVAFEGAEVEDGHVSAAVGDLVVEAGGIRANINRDRLVEISCGIDGSWPSEGWTFSAPRVQVTTDQAFSLSRPEIKARVKAENLGIEGPRAAAGTMNCEGTLGYDPERRALTFESLKLDLRGLVLKELSREALPPLSLEAEGGLDVAGKKIHVSRFNLALTGMADLEGGVQADLGSRPEMVLDLRKARIHPGRLTPYIPATVKGNLPALDLSGPVSLEGRGRGRKAGVHWEWDCDLGVRFPGNPFSCVHRDMELGGTLKGDLRVTGKVPDLEISGKMGTEKTRFSGTGIRAEPFETALSLNFRRPLLTLKGVSVRMPLVAHAVGTGGHAVRDIHLRLPEGTADLEKGALSLPRVELDTSLLKNLILTLAVDKEKTALSLDGKQAGLIEAAAALDLLPPGWRFSGRDAFRIEVLGDKAGSWSVTSRIAFNDLALENRDSSCMGEGIALATEINGRVDLAGPGVEVDAFLNIHGGELLYDRFYLNLGKNSFLSSLEGTYGLSRGVLEISRLRAGLKDLLSLEINGSLIPKVSDLRSSLAVRIPRTPLKPVFRVFVLDPFKAERPFLTTLDLGGSLSADLELTASGTQWEMKGHCLWEEGTASLRDGGTAFLGIDLDLPLWIRSRPGGDGAGPLKGKLTVRSVALPHLPEQPLDLTLYGAPDRIFLKDPTILGVPGGEITLGPVVVSGLFPPRPAVRTSLSMEAVELDPLLSTVWARPMGGTIRGELDPILFQDNVLTSRGELRAKLFGGDFTAYDVGAAGISTAAPLFRLNARWEHLNLADITRDTSFGKVQGVLQGHIRNLEIAYGQPQRFDLLLETVETKGVPQKISVRAVDNIARIGGGGSPFMGVAGVLSSFFREFPYQKIGVRASLENDVFRINGTVREDGTEYLVKRGSFSGVNIVNQNPDNRISFKDMVKRIKRVTASKGGPVVR